MTDEEIRERLRSAPAWQAFVGDGRAWVCPCCLETVEAPADADGAVIFDHICGHLQGRCPRPGADQQHAVIRQHQIAADTAFRWHNDSAWCVFDQQRRWICPACLMPSCGPSDDDDALLAEIQRHRTGCPQQLMGKLHPAPVVAASVAPTDATLPMRSNVPGLAADGAADGKLWMESTEIDVSDEPALSSDMDQARRLQLDLMRNAPTIAGFDIATFYQAAEVISGDFNQFIEMDDRMVFAQGDISGHGFRAGLLMAIANKLVELYAHQYADPKQAVIQVQRAMAADLGGASFLTLSYCQLEPGARRIRWVRAGHNPTLVWRAAAGRVDRLQPAGMVLGLPAHEIFAASLAVEETLLEPGDCFLLFTDGLSETMSPGQVQFEEAGVMRVMEQHAEASSEDLIAAIVAAVEKHRGDAQQDDDLSIIACRCTG